MSVRLAPGEICTVSAAKQYGIYHNKQILQPLYNDTRTFAKDVPNDSRRPKRLCTEESNGSEARKICSVEYGFGFTAKNLDQCIAGTSCPPSFVEEQGNPSRCRKPIISKEVDQRTRCDEKWHDWFEVENYHLGNKYESVSGACKKPCAPDSMPMYMKDPVDGQKVHATLPDDLSRCVSKDVYLNGKYSSQSDFCPMTWIKRLGTTKATINSELQRNVGKNLSSTNPSFKTQIDNRLQNVDSTALLFKCHSYLENIDAPSAKSELACSKIQTRERVDDAYNICTNVLNNESSIKSGWVSDGVNTADEGDVKMEVLKQACDQMFCYKKSNLPLLLRKPSICFRTRYVNTETYNEGIGRRFQVAQRTGDAGGAAGGTAGVAAGIGAMSGAIGAVGTEQQSNTAPYKGTAPKYGDTFMNSFSSNAKKYLKWLVISFLGVFMIMILVKLNFIFRYIKGHVIAI